MKGPSSGSPPPNDPRFSPQHTKKTSSSPLKHGRRSAGDRLLRVCWILLGGAFAAVFAFAIITVLVKRPPPRTSEATAPALAQNQETTPSDHPDRELPPVDRKLPPSDHPTHGREVDRVLGHGFTPSPAEDSLLPPPLPPPAQTRKPQAAPPKTETKDLPPPDADKNPPRKPSKPEPSDADVAIEKRLQMSADEAREKLLVVPELRLFSDLQIQTFRETQKTDEAHGAGNATRPSRFCF